MGQDFINRTEPTLRRSWDKGMKRFDGSNLFTPTVTWDERTILFELLDGAALREGERLTVRLDGLTLVALRGQERVAVATTPPAWALELVHRCYGAADGRVVRVNTLSATADVSLGAHV
jgi:hypothetical protein